MGKNKYSGSIIPMEKDKPKSRCRKWRLYVNTGYNVQKNRYERPSRVFHGTWSEAVVRLEELEEELNAQPNYGISQKKQPHITFSELAQDFIEFKETPGKNYRCYNTTRKYRGHVKVLNMQLANARVERITPEILQDTLSNIEAGQTPSGKIPSGTYLNMIHRTASLIFDYAIKKKIIHFNPCKEIDPPTVDTPERKKLNYEIAKKALVQMDARAVGSFVCGASIISGMRRGEICGLSWEDVDFQNKEIHISHNYTDKGELKAPKTKAGIRTIPLLPEFEDYLLTRKIWMEGIGQPTSGKNPIATNSKGERVLPHSITRWWDRNRSKIEIDGVSGILSAYSLHDLRHSYLSHLAMQGINIKVLQKLAGHAKYETTMNIYVHVTTDDIRTELQRIG